MLKVLFVLIIVALATYALTRVIQRRGVQPPLVTTRRSAKPSGPIGPDDDDEFLRELDRRRRDDDGP
ncbi:hypothetical protein SAMN04487968_104275 [Nocardioides terrae]|uniref:Uncharacterized protein n=1 Tax=Nocardioides terrae TaxID=574651 RepID=A0A1I1HDG3_9ACTN|nr:hypothetical protein [Nocardioides terrae]SFC21745.1 hypothetical protein SAMN04487968_104275 [Nocardioides terrae]